jgi:hypothetical protein
MRKRSLTAVAVVLATLISGPSFASSEPRAVPPNMIGLLLTPTGFDGKIYEPGQVDIGPTGWFADWGNKLVLLPRAGFAIKEQFAQNDPNNPNDHEDHRCIVGPKREPMSLDVRLLFALPDYTKPAGKDAILRMGLLGNPERAKPELYGGDRVLILNAQSVYEQQVQQQVRGKIRDVCIGYDSVEEVFKAVEKDGKEGGFTDAIRIAVATVLAENHSPLFLIGAVASNVKPDPAVVAAIAATQAAAKRIEAIKAVDDFIKADLTGQRAFIYKMMTLQEIAHGSGNNTLFMTDVGVPNGTPIPVH